MEDTKRLKIKLPVHQHIKLRTLKVMTGRTISEIVEQAVADYVALLEERGEIPAEMPAADPPAD